MTLALTLTHAALPGDGHVAGEVRVGSAHAPEVVWLPLVDDLLDFESDVTLVGGLVLVGHVQVTANHNCRGRETETYEYSCWQFVSLHRESLSQSVNV